jgi:hypothetical protein
VLSLYRLKALECSVPLSSLPNFFKAFFSKLWRAIHIAFHVLLCDLNIEASFVGAKQAKLGCIVALCCLKGKTTTKIVHPSLKCFFYGFLKMFFFSSYGFLICYSFFMVGRRQENSYAHDACMCV